MNLRLSLHNARHTLAALAKLGWERWSTGIVFNPLRQELRVDPHPFYRELRERDPFHRSWAGDGFVLSRYEDVVEVLRDPRFGADERTARFHARIVRRDRLAGLPNAYEEGFGSMLRLDPPDHTRLRGLVSKAFTPRAVERMRPRIAALVGELLEAAAPRGRMELVADFAAPLPVAVIAEMLGIPGSDRDRFRHWSNEAVRTLGDNTLDDRRRAWAALQELGEYLDGVVQQRRAAPRGDLLSALVAAEEEGSRLSSQELFATVILLLVAGNETTTKLIGNGLLALLRHPDQMRLLREEPKRIPGAVEELLRYDGPVQLTSRFALADCSFRGHRLRRGQQLVLLLAAANRDPVQFPDPERLDVTRENLRHLAFGQGIHFCLGAQLARLEAALAFEGLLERLPGLRLAAEPIEWSDNTVLRGPTRMALCW